MIKLIVAMSQNGLIGNGDKLPWHIKEELKFFKETTEGHALLMGDTTFLGLPGKLPGRKIIVLSKEAKKLGDKTIRDFKWVLDNYENSNNVIFISGGKSVYEQFYKYAKEIYISVIKEKYEGNVFLNINLDSYKKTKYKEFVDFIVYKYTREDK